MNKLAIASFSCYNSVGDNMKYNEEEYDGLYWNEMHWSKEKPKNCKLCGIKLQDNFITIESKDSKKPNGICPMCLIDNMNINEIFNDGILNEIRKKQTNVIKEDFIFLIVISIFFILTSIGLLVFTIISGDIDDFFFLIMIGVFALTGLVCKKTYQYKKSIPDKTKPILRTDLISSDFNRIEFKDVSFMTEIIRFGEYVEKEYNDDLNKISDSDIAYLANNKKITPEYAKSYINYYLRIKDELDNIMSNAVDKEYINEELSEYNESLEIYQTLINKQKYVENGEYFDEIETKLKDKLSANQYFNQMIFHKESIEYLPYTNIKLKVKVEMPEIVVLNKPTYIRGMIKVNLYENNEIVAEGYIHGDFKNNNNYEITCKKIKNIESIENLELKYELVVLWLP